MAAGPKTPLKDREMLVVSDVMDELGVKFDMDADSDGMVIWTNQKVYYGAEIYRYLLGDVCSYGENGEIKGLELDLCNDFYDLCKLNGVDPSEYRKRKKEASLEERIEGAKEQSDASNIESFNDEKEMEM